MFTSRGEPDDGPDFRIADDARYVARLAPDGTTRWRTAITAHHDVELAPDRAGLAATINALNALEDVEIAHPAPVCEPAVVYEPRAVEVPLASDLRTPDYTDLQDYLYDPPIGLNAPAAWAVASSVYALRIWVIIQMPMRNQAGR